MLGRGQHDLERSRKRSWDMIMELTKAGGAMATFK